MNRLRAIGLLGLTISGAWLAWRSFAPQPPQPAPTPPPEREAFHASKPLRIVVSAQPDPASNSTPDTRWLERELRYLIARGKMRVAPTGVETTATTKDFTLRVNVSADRGQAEVSLLAPDQLVERSEVVSLTPDSYLATMQSLAQHLPKFLAAPGTETNWGTALGTQDPAVYEAFVHSSDTLLAAQATGFTQPPPPGIAAVKHIEQLESLARRNRTFARARALLAVGYLSIGGEDQTSLTKLAATAAERALSIDPALADAQSALGIAQLRRMNWSAAREHFNAALAIDADSIPALEGLACLLIDVGHAKEALPVALRVLALQPGNAGGRECATYAQFANGQTPVVNDQPFAIARIGAAMLLLANNADAATPLLRSHGNSAAWLDSVVHAVTARDRVPAALQEITRAAGDEEIDAETEMLLGTALRRPDFVFNRMLRLAKQNEAVPLRLLWLPQTDFLRQHRRFREVIGAAAVASYWQDHAVADICSAEPKVYGCTQQRTR